MAENDSEIMDNTNGDQEDEFSTLNPPVMMQKSLFGNSASRLREAQLDEIAEKTKELNDSKNSGSLGEQAADESSSFDKEGSPAPEDEPMPQQNDPTKVDNGSLVEDANVESKEENTSAIEKDKESDVGEEINDAEESDDEAEETSSAEEPKSLADELGELQNNKEDQEDDVEKESTDKQVEESNDSALVEENVLVNKDETKAESPKPVMDEDEDEEEEDDDDDEDKIEEQGEEQKVAIEETPKTSKAASSARSSARRSTRQKDDSKPVEETTPLTSTKRASRGRGAAAAETPKMAEKATPVSKSARRSVRKEKDETETEVEEAKVEPVTETPKRGKKAEPMPKKEKQKEAEETPSRTLRKRPSMVPEKAETPRNTPRGKKASQTPATAKTEKEEPEEEVAEKIAEPKSQQRTPRSRKSVATASKTESKDKTKDERKKDKEQDPFDFDEMADKHPEPLKNIQVEVQSFGAMRFSKVGSGKYSNTEKAAEGRVGISTPTPEKSSTPRVSLMDLSRKEAELATQATPRSAPSRRKKVDDEEMDYETSTQKAALSKSAPAPKSRKRRSSPATVTPKKPKVEVPILSKAEQIAVDWRNDDLDNGVLPGARVYALYDKVFYPAIVISSVSGFGRIQVQFVQDQLTKELPESAVIPVVQLSSERLAVVQTDKADVKVVVVDPPTKETLFECVFHLRSIDDGPNEAPKDYHMAWNKLILDHDDWTDYIKLKDTQATEVKAANIENGKAKLTRSARHNSASTTPVITKSKTEPKGKTPKAEATPKAEKPTNSAKEPVKEKTDNAKFFSGYAFLLTSASRPAPDNQVPFKKNELKQRIQQRGGKIIESVVETTEGTPILISDTYYRTMKYLAALASDVSCVSHEWVHECVKQETFLDFGDYLLQAGASIVDEKIHACKKLKGQLLKGKRVCIYSLQEKAGPNLTFSEIWQPIVVSLGAEVVKYSDVGNLDYFITDPSCHVDTAKEAMDQGAMVLSSEWLIQTIIMGEPQHPDAHARFAYNYSGNQ